MGNFIINFTPNGMFPTRHMTTHVPISPDEIINEVLEARKYGVSMVHLHARNKEGKPTWEKKVYKEIIDGIRSVDGYNKNSLIICVSTSGRNWAEFEKRSECLDLEGASKPDMASLTLSSFNFSRSASVNSPEMIQKLAGKMKEKGIKPELEVFDTGMVNYAKYLQKKGLIKPPFYFNLLFGNIATAQAELLDLSLILTNLPEESYWSAAGIGRSQLKMNLNGIINGGGIRIGLEDNIFFDSEGSKLASNLELLKRINDISGLIEMKPYTPAEVRRLLNLGLWKG
ncbi:MAG: 3-keto-5-aminohexanoate cleavage protein [Chlorobi bacterium]|nr:3-keto-5-aminohexanoate cleavage protein [Chlorobiota bacterium]